MMRLYVLVRADLSRSQQAVQAGHAVAAWCENEAARTLWDGRELQTLPWRWGNGNLIYLKVRNENELRSWFERFREKEDLWGRTEGAVGWREPDLDNQMTAFAVACPDAETFEELGLL